MSANCKVSPTSLPLIGAKTKEGDMKEMEGHKDLVERKKLLMVGFMRAHLGPGGHHMGDETPLSKLNVIIKGDEEQNLVNDKIECTPRNHETLLYGCEERERDPTHTLVKGWEMVFDRLRVIEAYLLEAAIQCIHPHDDGELRISIALDAAALRNPHCTSTLYKMSTFMFSKVTSSS